MEEDYEYYTPPKGKKIKRITRKEWVELFNNVDYVSLGDADINSGSGHGSASYQFESNFMDAWEKLVRIHEDWFEELDSNKYNPDWAIYEDKLQDYAKEIVELTGFENYDEYSQKQILKDYFTKPSEMYLLKIVDEPVSSRVAESNKLNEYGPHYSYFDDLGANPDETFSNVNQLIKSISEYDEDQDFYGEYVTYDRYGDSTSGGDMRFSSLSELVDYLKKNSRSLNKADRIIEIDEMDYFEYPNKLIAIGPYPPYLTGING